MSMKNVFVFGAEVSGDSFFGRHQEIAMLSKEMDPPKGNKGIAIIGMNRIGKSSLIRKVLDKSFVDRPDIIIVETNLGRSSTPRAFWHHLVTLLREAVASKGIRDEEIEGCFDSILTGNIGSEIWFSSVFEVGFSRILKCVSKLGFRVILLMDEFDKASDLFSSELGSFGVIRDCAILSDYCVTIVLLSRRRLGSIEKESLKGSGSTLEEAFFKCDLKGFSEDDMCDYWAALTDYDVYHDQKMDEAIRRYAGTNPYILCFYGYHMAEAAIAGEVVSAATVERIHDELRGTHLLSYYEKLYARIKEDGYAEKLRGVLCGPNIDISSYDVERLMSWGYLHIEKQQLDDTASGSENYCLVCPDFNRYFVEQSCDILLPAWDSITKVEMRFREYMRKVFPRLDTFRYSEIGNIGAWQTRIKDFYPRLLISVDMVKQYMENANTTYGRNASLIDVLALSYIIDIIKQNWDSFRPYFGNQNLNKWEEKLELIKRARNPIAHSHPEYLTKMETNQVRLYCSEILAL